MKDWNSYVLVFRNSNATKVPTFGGATSHPGFAHPVLGQGGSYSTEADDHVQPVDHSYDRETNEKRSNSNDEEGHGQASGEIVNHSQENEEIQDEEQMEDAIVQNDFAQNSMPLIQVTKDDVRANVVSQIFIGNASYRRQ